jgi:cytoplasmic iron level regulating protein YaaA (DUF328/UPF0246 family)
MMILLSPSKSQNFHGTAPTKRGTVPELIQKSVHVAKALRQLDANQIGKLMRVSDKLADFTYERAQNWNPRFNEQKRETGGLLNFKQAMFAYTGDVYTAFEHGQYSAANYSYLTKHLRILSGLYGVTRPLDYIKPYRLEMGTKLPIPSGKETSKNLYEYWTRTVTDTIARDLKKDDVIINLASQEYAKIIDRNVVGERIVDVYFKVKKNGTYVTVGVIAKRQRGELAYWMMKNNVTKLVDIKKYKHGGFAYNKKLSSESEIVFTM